MTRRIPLPACGPTSRPGILWTLAALLMAALVLLAPTTLAALSALTGHFPTLGPEDGLTLRDRLLDLHARHPVVSVAAYMAGYVLMTACSIPGAVFLTLTGGAVFGFGVALAAVSAASTAGACLAFLSARHLLRATVRRLWPGQLARIDAAMAQGGGSPGGPTQAGTQPPSPFPDSSDHASAVHAAAGQASPARPPSGVPGSGLISPGALCLLGLRCVPVMPYWLVNLLFGVTAMRLSTFATVSLLGMVPLNALYVHAGAELGRIRHLGDIISLRAGLALCLLAVAPLLLRRVARTPQARPCTGTHPASATDPPR
uniref:SNARE associated Golgi protein n=1 Tax=Nitratidesulfovibrio vulgaris (strain DSM 19637 / Miyazaki F) TaxID=883 RepID=B8DM88_NITV9